MLNKPGVVMFNHASVDFEVKAGDRIAQLVCERISYPEIQVNHALIISMDLVEGLTDWI